MIEATLTLAALLPLACWAAWRVGYARGHKHGSQIAADAAWIKGHQAGLAAAQQCASELDDLPRRDPKTGRFVSRRKA